MNNKDWIDISSFGAELKKLNLPNGSSIPIVVITDIDKFNSTAVNLSVFRDSAPSDIPFDKLPGDKKGRAFNQPILYMTKSFQAHGDSKYPIVASLAKLLNISPEEVKKLKTKIPENQIVSEIPYADFDKFSSIVDSCYHAYAGNTLYAVRSNAPVSNLVEYAEALQANQHSLFPKANIGNIPFRTLDNLGLNTSIVGRAFLNPLDARNQGYQIEDLTRIHLGGEMSVLPISINKDKSINYISNVADLSQLAFSNYKWRDNIGIINDFNALVAVREASRSILNTKPSAIQSPDQMEGIIESMSVALQNFNETNGVSNSHKVIKYFNNGVTAHLVKNAEGEWRYIEREGTKKTDEPLTWVNYRKALTTIANYNSILSAALEMEVKHGADFNHALETVFKNHKVAFDSHVQIVNSPDDIVINNKLVINTQGKKVSKSDLGKTVDSFARDMGASLYTESVKKMLNDMRSTPDAGNINNVVGPVVDEYSLLNTAEVVSSPLDDSDIGLSILDRLAEGEIVDFKIEAEKEKLSVIPKVDISRYSFLPKSISPKVDANYAAVNDMYQTLQYIELSQIPYYEKQRADYQSELAILVKAQSEDLNASYKSYLKNGDAVFATQQGGNNTEAQERVATLRDNLDKFDTQINHCRIQGNILRYQLVKSIGDQEMPMHGLLVLQSDNQGNYVPFRDAIEYRSAVQLVQNGYAAQNIEILAQHQSELSKKLTAFVEQHYSVTAVEPSEPIKMMETAKNSIQKAYVFASPQPHVVQPLPIAQVQINQIHDDIFSRANYAFNNYLAGAQAKDSLDSALIAVARYGLQISQVSGIEFSPTNNPEFNSIIRNFSVYDGELSYPAALTYNHPDTWVQISDMSKLEILKAVADTSLSALDTNDPAVSNRIRDYALNLAEARLVAREKIEQTPASEMVQNMAGQFLLFYQDSFKSKNQPADEIYYYQVNGNETSFRVKSAKPENVPTNAVSLVHANTLNVATREAFAAYQLHQTANALGISFSSLSDMQLISDKLKHGDNENLPEMTQNTFGFKLTASDFNSMTLNTSDLKDAQGNKLVAVQAADLGQVHLTHDASQKLFDMIALTNKMAGIESEFRVNPLINAIGDYSEFDKVQKYLMPELEEHGILQSIIQNDADVNAVYEDLSKKGAEYAITAYKSALAQGVIISPSRAAVATNHVRKTDEVVFSRIIPAAWNLSLNTQTNIDHNITNINENSGDLTAELISGYTNEHIKFGNYRHGGASAPVLPGVVSTSIPYHMSTAEKSVLQDCSAVKSGSLQDIADLMRTYTATNFSVALNNLPKPMIEQFHAVLRDELHPSDMSIRVTMTDLSGTDLPKLHLNSVNAELSENEKYICRLNGSDIKLILEENGFAPENLGTEPVCLQPENNLLEMHDIFLERTNFNLNNYLDNASVKLGIPPLQMESMASVVDSLPTVNFEESQLSFRRLQDFIAVTKAMLESQGIKSGNAIISQAKVFIKARDGNLSMAIAQSEDKCLDLITEGYKAACEQYSPYFQPDGLNILHSLNQPIKTPNDLINADALVSQFFNVINEPVPDAETNLDQANAYMDELLSNPTLYQSVVDSAVEVISDLNTLVPEREHTTFADDLKVNTHDQVENMRPAELAENIQLIKVWPQASIQDHIHSGHQNIDTLMLGYALRSCITSTGPVVREDSSFEQEAIAYNFFLTEMHGAISKSKTPADLLKNYDKAYSSVVNMHPTFFSQTTDNQELNSQNESFNAFRKASHAYKNGVDASEALKVALSDPFLTFNTQYNDIALDVGKLEQLYSIEKPYTQYLNGYTLNAEESSADWVSYQIMSRMGKERCSEPTELTPFETDDTAVHRDIVNVLKAISALDYDHSQATVDIHSKWGVELKVGDRDMHYGKGFNNIADGLLAQMQESLGSRLTEHQIGRGLIIQGGVPFNLDDKSDLYITDVSDGIDGNLKFFANRYVNQLVRKIEQNEVAHMVPEEISKYSAVKEDYCGLVTMAQKYGYEPRTEAAKSLISIHQALVLGSVDSQVATTVQTLLDHSRSVVSTKFTEVLRNASIYTEDYSGDFAKHFASYMQDRQDSALKNLSDKMRKIEGLNPDAPDLYHFTSTVDSFDRISNTANIGSKSVVDKYIQDCHGSKPKTVQESIALLVNTAIAEKSESIQQVQDFLSARAADKFIVLLDQYAPENIKGSEKFVEQVQKYFGSKLGENSQFKRMLYQSEFGHSLETNHKNLLLTYPENTPSEINADQVVFKYLDAVVDPSKETYLNEQERQAGLDMLANVLIAHDTDRTAMHENEKVSRLKMTNDHSRESPLDYRS